MQTRLYGICYKATAPSGKAYIGQTASDFSKRKSAHRKDTRNPCPLHHALKKYGDAMRWEIVACAWDKEGLDFAERTLIAQHGTLSPNGYNLKTGGANGKPCDETKAKLSAKASRQWNSPEYRRKHAAAMSSPAVLKKMKKGVKERNADPEYQAKHALGIGAANARPEVKANRSAASKKVGRTLKERKRRSNVAKAQWANPAHRALVVAAAKEQHRQRRLAKMGATLI